MCYYYFKERRIIMDNNNFEVQQAVNQALVDQKKKKKKKRLIIIGVILAIIVIGGIIGSSGSDSKTETTTATIAAGEEKEKETETAVEAKNEKTEGEIGDYICTIKEAKVCKNWEGKDSVKITYSFTNNSKSPESFDVALTDEVYQDGIQLESTFISSDDDDWGIDVKIKPGMSKDVSKVYILRDKETELEVEISELISFSDDKLVTKVKLEK